jgi:hypothetical protein
LLERVRRGENPGAILLAELAEPERETLKRCALPRVFTAQLYDDWLRANDGPALSGLVHRGFVERVPDMADRYRLVSRLRSHAWELWLTPPSTTSEGKPPHVELSAEGKEFAAQLADAYQTEQDNQTKQNELERLSLLALTDSNEASQVFEEAFKAADRKVDLSRCQDLLAALLPADRAAVIDSSITALHYAYWSRLSARGLWHAESRSTRPGRYAERVSVEKVMRDALDLDRPNPRILWLHAPGGVGKTTQLLWLIAWYCVSYDPPIPCARIDLDTLDPAMAAKHPWLLLLEVAEQLDRQLPNAPFRQLLRERGDYRQALHQVTWPPPDEVAAADIIDRFVRTLADSSDSLSKSTPVVIIVDTLEELITGRRAGLDRLVSDVLAPIAEKASRVRVVLAGRVGPDDLPSQPANAPAETPYKLRGFTAKEARTYLTEIRGLESAATEVLDAIIDESRIESPGDPAVPGAPAEDTFSPFLLERYADVVVTPSSEPITPEQIRSESGPDLLYAFERVLARIEKPQLQWLLLFAAVPRVLTREFFVDHLVPHLPDPAEFKNDPRAPAPPDTLPGRADLESLWKTLTSYKGDSMWIREAAVGAGENALCIDRRVRVTLRRLLLERHRLTCRHLDGSAAAHFTTLARHADDDELRWASWTCEELYHRFQQCGAITDTGNHDQELAAATDAWRAALRKAWERGWLKAVRKLATDVIDSSEYQTDDPARTTAAKEPRAKVMTRQVWYEAHLHLARVYAREAECLPPVHASINWTHAEAHLDQATLVREQAGDIAWSPQVEELLRRRLEWGRPPDGAAAAAGTPPVRRPPAPAVSVRSPILAGGLEPMDRRDACFLDARILVDQPLAGGADPALQAFEQAYDRTPATDVTGRQRIVAEIMQRLVLTGRPDAAEKFAQDKKLAMRPGTDPTLAYALARTTLALGRPAALLANFGDSAPIRTRSILAEAWLQCHRPRRAIACLTDRASPATSGEHEDFDVRREIVLARSHARLLNLDDAMAVLQRAEDAATTSFDRARIALARGRLHLHAAGDLIKADYHLDAAARFARPTNWSADGIWFRVQLAKIQVADLRQDAAEAQRLIDGLLGEFDDLMDDGTPLDRSRIVNIVSLAHCGLALSSIDAEDWSSWRRADFWSLLTRAISQVASADAQLVLLSDLRRCRHPLPPGADRSREVLRTVMAAVDGKWHRAEDQALRDITLAEVHRVLGEAKSAHDRLSSAVARLARDDPYIWWKALVRHPHIRTDVSAAMVGEFRQEYEEAAPTLVASFLIQACLQQLEDNRRDESLGKFLKAANGLLAKANDGTVETGSANRWYASLVEAQAVLAKANNQTEARSLSQEADTAWRRLGHARSTARSDEKPTAHPEIVLKVVSTDQEAVVELRISNQPKASVRLAETFIDQLRRDQIATKIYDAFAHERHATLPGMWDGARGARPLWRQLERLVADVGRGERADVRLEDENPRYARLPWELPGDDNMSLPFHAKVRYVYRANGASREQAEETIRDFAQRALNDAGLAVAEAPPARESWDKIRADLIEQRRREPGRPQVLILQLSGGNSVDPTMYAKNFATGVVRADSRADLNNKVRGRISHVVHIVTVMDGSEPIPRLALEGSRVTLTPIDLDNALRILGVRVPPLVVLDVVRPSSRYEAIRQLLLRNEFAHHLHALGGAAAVIATGLHDRGRREKSHRKVLPEMLGADHTPAEVCQAIQQQHRSVGHSDLGCSATALFSMAAPDALFPPGLLAPLDELAPPRLEE